MPGFIKYTNFPKVGKDAIHIRSWGVPSFCSHVPTLLAVLNPLLVAMVLIGVQDIYLKISNQNSGKENRRKRNVP